mmetsp:Transcript_80545/g.181759  ORF Transcript_80545/g.181759 Transcript_80545/m.181759 type:complete len:351 (+) Transcript_80545:1452-2504(+)
MRVPPNQDLIQAACGVLYLAACVELLPLYQLLPLLAVSVAHTFLPLRPDVVIFTMRYQPHAICAAGAHPTTAVPDHGVQTEELGVVVVHVVGFVRILGVVLRGLGKRHLFVQGAVGVEEARNARKHEVRLELVPRVGNGVEGRRLVLLIVVVTNRPARVERQVIVNKVQASRLAVAGPQGHVVRVMVLVMDSIHHLLGPRSQLEPVLRRGTTRHLVVPGAHGHVLHHDVARVLDWLGPRGVVHPEGNTMQVLGLPVSDVVKVRSGLRELVVIGPDVLRESLKSCLQRCDPGLLEVLPLCLGHHLRHRGSAHDPVQNLVIQLLDLPTNLRQGQHLGLCAPRLCELQDVALV